MNQKDSLIKQLLDKIADLEKQVADLLLKVEQQATVIAHQAATITHQASKIEELERRLNKDSTNSSKPPSSDGLSKPPKTSSLRQPGKNKSGGQIGHPGETLKQVSAPDEIKTYRLNVCPTCSTSLSSISAIGIVKRQVFDLPMPRVIVTEHQAEAKICPCCQKRVVAAFPDRICAPVQYGEVIQSLAIYLQHQHYIPEDRLQETFRDLFGVHLATATLNGFSEGAYQALADFEETVLSNLKSASVKHLDETGFRIAGQTQWLHVASTTQLTYYHISPKRNSLLEGLSGIVIHDHWKPYYQLQGVSHALCNQHHLRELKAVIENDSEIWAKKMQRFLRLALHYRHEQGEKVIPENKLKKWIRLYEKIVDQGIHYHEGLPAFSTKKRRGRIKRRTGHNLVLRLKYYKDDVLRFLYNPLVPFTNNQAEQDIRMMKCKQKISGGFRSEQGSKIFARLRGFISTARKQGWNIFESIIQVTRSSVPMPA